jgi:hypothetical protein
MKLLLNIIGWLGKNSGLILGLLEIVVKAIVEIIVQVVKVIAGIANVLQPSRSKDTLVNLAAKLEGIVVWINNLFTKVKGWLYNIAPK